MPPHLPHLIPSSACDIYSLTLSSFLFPSLAHRCCRLGYEACLNVCFGLSISWHVYGPCLSGRVKRGLIAATALGLPARHLKQLTSPLLSQRACERVGRKKGGGLKWLVYRSCAMTHYENKTLLALNYHIHLRSAVSDVVLVRHPDQQQTCGLEAFPPQCLSLHLK